MFFDKPLFDLNGDGKETAMEVFVGMQMMAHSREEAIKMTGDDTFYLGKDKPKDDREK